MREKPAWEILEIFYHLTELRLSSSNPPGYLTGQYANKAILDCSSSICTTPVMMNSARPGLPYNPIEARVPVIQTIHTISRQIWQHDNGRQHLRRDQSLRRLSVENRHLRRPGEGNN
ncbi:hypothetical protein VTN00DRAFT_1306 [Thermoascus crustaceus]|uniref:uncharacterized protein n=1 Tax=Thermoascus crustaceus TaxID=5088 RepID=UPI003742F910